MITIIEASESETDPEFGIWNKKVSEPGVRWVCLQDLLLTIGGDPARIISKIYAKQYRIVNIEASELTARGYLSSTLPEKYMM